MKKVLIIGGCVLAIAIAGYMMFRSQPAPVVDTKAAAAAAKAASEMDAQATPEVVDPNAPKSKADRMKFGK
jgi:uncharacterized protein YpmB